MLVSVRQGDWMVSIDLRDAPGRLVVQAPSLEACLRARDMVRLILGLWNSELREVAPRSIPEDYDLGVNLDSVRLRASPTLKRRVKVPSLVEEFPLRAAADHLLTGPAGPPSSLVQLVLGPRLRMRALQIELCRGEGVFRAEENMVRWSPQGQEDLLGGLRRIVSRLGSVSLRFYQSSCPGPTLRIRKGARSSVQRSFSGLCTETERGRSINWRDLRSVRLDLRTFRPRLKTGTAVAGFVDNQTAVVYLRSQGGTRSEALNEDV